MDVPNPINSSTESKQQIKVTRLHIGASRLEKLNPRILNTFLDNSWIHLGDAKEKNKKRNATDIIKLLRHQTFPNTIKKLTRVLLSRNNDTNCDVLYDKTHFQQFYFHKGDNLPFHDRSFNFIFSEHFFEHLFFDETISLFRECHRILKPFGVVRICVPDADLRTYEQPEPAGYPDNRLPYTHPNKHKTRWSVYCLTEALKLTGFLAVPLRYCNKYGEYKKCSPNNQISSYDGCPEKELIYTFDYINRIDSLIVDGIKTE